MSDEKLQGCTGGTYEDWIKIAFREAQRLGHPPTSSKHAITYLVGEVERLRAIEPRFNTANQNYRQTDPSTSAQAGQEVEAEGIARQQRAACFECVLHNPGMTAHEIEARIKIKAHKRLPELREAGLIINGDIRACRITRRRAMTWYLARDPDAID